MNLGGLLHLFVSDVTVKTIAALIAADFVLGVVAALKDGTFSIGYLHGFLINDILAKVVPFFAIYAAAKSGVSDVWFQALRDTTFATVVAGMTASILKSLGDLGFTQLPHALTGEKKLDSPSITPVNP